MFYVWFHFLCVCVSVAQKPLHTLITQRSRKRPRVHLCVTHYNSNQTNQQKKHPLRDPQHSHIRIKCARLRPLDPTGFSFIILLLLCGLVCFIFTFCFRFRVLLLFLHHRPSFCIRVRAGKTESAARRSSKQPGPRDLWHGLRRARVTVAHAVFAQVCSVCTFAHFVGVGVLAL